MPRPYPCVVMTDLEPDDVAALYVLAHRGFEFTAVVVGEGNVQAKVRRARELVRLLGFDDEECRVLPGLPSSKLFPGEKAEEADDADESEAPPVDAFLNDLTFMPEPLLICLKPPTEVLAALQRQPERCTALFADTTLAIYGSYNLRSLGYEATVPLVSSATTPFARVLLYESHGNGVPNLNPRTVPGWATWMERNPVFQAVFRSVCKTWDDDIVRDCDESCAEEEAKDGFDAAAPSARWHRNDKCRVAVRANCGNQCVPADVVLALLLFNDAFPSQAASYEFSAAAGPYPTCTLLESSSSSKTSTWKDLDGDKVVAALSAVMA